MKLKLLVLPLLFLSTAGATDGGEVNNGGDARVCFESKEIRNEIKALFETDEIIFSEDPSEEGYRFTQAIESVEFYDLFRARNTPSYTFAEFKGETPEEIIGEVLQRISEKSNFDQVLEFAKSRMSEMVLSESGVARVDDVPSEKYRKESEKCLVLQLANQSYDEGASDLWVNKILIEKLIEQAADDRNSVLDLAAFEVHERLQYLNGIYQTTTSESVIAFTQYLFSQEFIEDDYRTFDLKIRNLGFSSHEEFLNDYYGGIPSYYRSNVVRVLYRDRPIKVFLSRPDNLEDKIQLLLVDVENAKNVLQGGLYINGEKIDFSVEVEGVEYKAPFQGTNIRSKGFQNLMLLIPKDSIRHGSNSFRFIPKNGLSFDVGAFQVGFRCIQLKCETSHRFMGTDLLPTMDDELQEKLGWKPGHYNGPIEFLQDKLRKLLKRK